MLKRIILGVAGAALTSSFALAAGDITPTGSVPVSCTVTGDQTIAVDFGVAVQSTVGAMTILCNNAAGFKVNAGSQNTSKLCSDTGCGANKERGYKATWLGQAANIAIGSTATPVAGADQAPAFAPVNVAFVMELDSTGTADLVAGTYTDPISITVSTL